VGLSYKCGHRGGAKNNYLWPRWLGLEGGAGVWEADATLLTQEEREAQWLKK
jgi:hypothetical protein